MSIFDRVSRYGTRTIAGAALLGLLFPDAAAMLRPYLGNFVVTMLIVSLLRVDFAAFLARLRAPTLALASAGWITLAIPLAVLMCAVALDANAIVLAVLFLFLVPPPIVSAPAFALLMGLDGALVLAVMLFATVAMPLTSPLLADLFVRDILPIGAIALAARLAGLIAFAFLVSLTLRWLLGARRIAASRSILDTISVAIAVMFAIGAMDGVAERLVTDPAFTLFAGAAAFAVMLAQMGLTYAVFRPVVGADAVAIAYACGNRNAGLVIAAIGVQQVSDTLWLFFAMSQLPVFIFPLVLSPLGRRLSARTPAVKEAS